MTNTTSAVARLAYIYADAQLMWRNGYGVSSWLIHDAGEVVTRIAFPTMKRYARSAL